jgi:hypothetical protein
MSTMRDYLRGKNIYMFICIHIYVYICIHIHFNIYKYRCMYIYTYMYIHINISGLYICRFKRYVYNERLPKGEEYIYVHMYTYICIYKYTYACSYVYI